MGWKHSFIIWVFVCAHCGQIYMWLWEFGCCFAVVENRVLYWLGGHIWADNFSLILGLNQSVDKWLTYGFVLYLSHFIVNTKCVAYSLSEWIIKVRRCKYTFIIGTIWYWCSAVIQGGNFFQIFVSDLIDLLLEQNNSIGVSHDFQLTCPLVYLNLHFKADIFELLCVRI